MWTILLTSGIPTGQTKAGHAAELLPFLFTESEHPWFFFLMAALPGSFLVLAAWHWVKRAANQQVPGWVWALNGVATTFSLLALWPSGVASFAAAYYAHRSNRGAQPVIPADRPPAGR